MHPSRSVTRSLFAVAAPALAVTLLAGCGGGASETEIEVGETGTSTTESSDGQSTGSAVESSDAMRVCDALTAVDPDTAFAGFAFGAPEPRADSAWCRLPVTNAEGEGLTAFLDAGGLFDAYQEQYADDGDVYREIEGLGDEAYILNNAQVHVREGQSEWMVSLQAMVMMADEPSVPAPEAIEAGLTKIAQSLLED